MAEFGYARVSMAPAKSRRVQHVDGQVQRLLAEGIPEDHIYVDDGRSGKLRSRPEWDRLLTVLRKDDVLVATKLDRIGRSLVNLVDVVNLLGERGVQMRVLDQSIDTSTAMGKFFFQLMAALAELEASLTRERTVEGLAAAKDRHGGTLPVRGPAIKPDQIETARMLALAHPDMSAADRRDHRRQPRHFVPAPGVAALREAALRTGARATRRPDRTPCTGRRRPRRPDAGMSSRRAARSPRSLPTAQTRPTLREPAGCPPRPRARRCDRSGAAGTPAVSRRSSAAYPQTSRR